MSRLRRSDCATPCITRPATRPARLTHADGYAGAVSRVFRVRGHCDLVLMGGSPAAELMAAQLANGVLKRVQDSANLTPENGLLLARPSRPVGFWLILRRPFLSGLCALVGFPRQALGGRSGAMKKGQEADVGDPRTVSCARASACERAMCVASSPGPHLG